jgi:hypothetical protein
MTQGYAAPYPVFDGDSADAVSGVFWISEGWVAELMAFDFRDTRVSPEPGRPSVTQAACVRRVLLKGFEPPEPENLPCGVIPDISGYRAEILADGPLVTDGCAWGLSACDNYRLLDIPGGYRLALNDPGAVGQVRVYMVAHPLREWPSRPSRLYFGE